METFTLLLLTCFICVVHSNIAISITLYVYNISVGISSRVFETVNVFMNRVEKELQQDLRGYYSISFKNIQTFQDWHPSNKSSNHNIHSAVQTIFCLNLLRINVTSARSQLILSRFRLQSRNKLIA